MESWNQHLAWYEAFEGRRGARPYRCDAMYVALNLAEGTENCTGGLGQHGATVRGHLRRHLLTGARCDGDDCSPHLPQAAVEESGGYFDGRRNNNIAQKNELSPQLISHTHTHNKAGLWRVDALAF
jgi:hypothetical protein